MNVPKCDSTRGGLATAAFSNDREPHRKLCHFKLTVRTGSLCVCVYVRVCVCVLVARQLFRECLALDIVYCVA